MAIVACPWPGPGRAALAAVPAPSRVGRAVLLLAVLAAGCSRPAADAPLTPRSVIPVKVIHPRRDPRFVVAVKQPAYVDGFFRAELLARAAGPVRYIGKDIGNPVRFGELLMVIDAPDRVQAVAEATATWQQRQAELRLAIDQIAVMEESVATAQSNIDVQQAQVKQLQATVTYRKSEYERFVILADRRAVTPDVVDEQLKNYQSAVAAHQAAEAAVRQATSSWKEAKAKLEAARADVLLKRTLVDVAQQRLAYARVEADFARIYAPFDGVVIRRDVDPGSFVQNATTSGGKPFLTLLRTDLVTVVMRVPDNYAPYVSRDTTALIEMDELPGVVIESKVTRSATAIDARDRTMQVEVDLFNRSHEEYTQALLHGLGSYLAAVGNPCLLEGLMQTGAGMLRWSRNLKGANSELVPLFPKLSGQVERYRPLLPGMYGSMRLLLRNLAGSHLLPSGAVFSRGGKLYILRVQEGVARLVPVRVQVDDGTLAQVLVIVREADARAGVQEVTAELTGDEEIVNGNQGEIADGQQVRATLVAW